MTSMTADRLADLPLAPETQKYLESTLIGHVIDGEVVSSRSGETMPIINPATGQEIGRAARGGPEDVELAVASARRSFDDGRWRNLAPLEKERRLRRLSELVVEHGEVFSDLDVLDAGLLKVYTGFIVKFALDAIDYFSGWPTKISGTIPAVPGDVAVYVTREPVGVLGLIVPWNGPTAVPGLRRRRPGVRQLRRVEAGRADDDGRRAHGPAVCRGRASRPGSSTCCRAPATWSAPASSLIPASTPSPSPVRSTLAGASKRPRRRGSSG